MIFVLLATIFFGVSDSFWKPILDSHSVIPAMKIRTIISSFVLILITLIFGKLDQGSLYEYSTAIVPSLLSATAFICLVKAFKKSSVSVVITINSLTLIVAQVTAFILFHEVVNFFNYSLVLVLIITSIFLLNGGKLKFNKGIKFAVIASILFGISYPLLSIPSNTIGSFQTGVIQELVLLISLFIVSWLSPTERSTPNNIDYFKNINIYIVALGAALGISLLFYSYTILPVYQVQLICSFVPVIALIISGMVFKERLTKIQKVGVTASLIATLLIVTDFV